MKKSLSIAAVFTAGFLAVGLMPREPVTPQVDQAALNAQIDSRLHVVLSKLARDAQARQLASR